MQLKYILIFALLILFVYWLSGCSLTLQIDTEYAAQKGNGTISEQTTTEATTEQTPTVDINAELE